FDATQRWVAEETNREATVRLRLWQEDRWTTIQVTVRHQASSAGRTVVVLDIDDVGAARRAGRHLRGAATGRCRALSCIAAMRRCTSIPRWSPCSATSRRRI